MANGACCRRDSRSIASSPIRTRSADLKARLELVQDARAFAVTALGLPDNRSYRTYADIHRPYVVWNVVAAPEFSVKPLRWCFPDHRLRRLPRLFQGAQGAGLRCTAGSSAATTFQSTA